MRNLTIQRRKSMVAMLAVVQIFAEDPSGDVVIRKTRCRKLGEVKNGQTVTFSIGEEAVRIFALHEMFSRNYAHDFYDIPAGTEDILLAGENRVNLFTGHGYRFDRPKKKK
ncbi:MAG: hypothetical protein E7457_04960 [Ruminococcaceae bacterium]|nr:hypothetical protein [Oscillospiraceae bacterium]